MQYGEAIEMALGLMKKHGKGRWTLALNRSKCEYGSCEHSTKTITLSRDLLRRGSRREVRDSVLHEIAHALCSPRVTHGPEWRRIAKSIGARPLASAGSRKRKKT